MRKDRPSEIGILDPVPYEDFGGEGALLHFAHANGYPPGAYRPLLELLCQRYHVVAMRQRPLWPGSNPDDLSDWRLLADDLAAFLDQHGWAGILGAGHSFGAISTLRLALRRPQAFSALLLIDPVLFLPRRIILWKLIYRIGLSYRLHPLVKAAMRRRSTFESSAAMFANYRSKKVFSRLSDAALHAYVDSLACATPQGAVELCYPSAWEARVYVTGLLADLELWRDLPELKPPLLIVYGADSDTFQQGAAQRIQRRLPSAHLVPIPTAGHLVPLEKPQAVFESIIRFIETTDSSDFHG